MMGGILGTGSSQEYKAKELIEELAELAITHDRRIDALIKMVTKQQDILEKIIALLGQPLEAKGKGGQP